MSELEQLTRDALDEIAQATSLDALDAQRVKLLGKQGAVTAQLKQLGALPPEQRKAHGEQVNRAKQQLQDAIAERREHLEQSVLHARLASERIDVTLPGRNSQRGNLHPVSRTLERITDIFGRLGFELADGPEIEDDWHNFEALNFPPHHPARAMHDTFYFGDGRLLRTHTSGVQVRTMEANQPPIRIIAPGRTFRSDSDQTHTPMFHQVEGLVLDETTHLGHLKWALLEFCRAFFEIDDPKMRFRASHFPFTEPSMEVDINCSWEGGKVSVGVGDSWLEILGSGMVHPNVIAAGGLDPERCQGFA
ncbi:MAG: phenylalanine--tRNA ligase subunit alpha, partial [Proteobacteria bacterium]|nr:phenylalanine--tRNA ligase subunit alpha [Pseudomonadota bacterium]